MSTAIVGSVSRCAQVLIAFFYVVGPLALIDNIPSHSGTGGRWFRAFCTVCCWPLVSSILLRLATALTSNIQNRNQSGAGSGVLDSVVALSLMVALSFAAPALAASLVGGAIHNVVAPGAIALLAMGKVATSQASRSMSGAAGIVGETLRAANFNDQAPKAAAAAKLARDNAMPRNFIRVLASKFKKVKNETVEGKPFK